MSTIATKFQMGTAACAIAAAAVLTPGAVAQAEPAAPAPTTGLGSSVVAPSCGPVGPVCFTPAAPNAQGLPSVGGRRTILQNPLWWFGAPNANPPAQQVHAFYPLALLPGFFRPLLGWFSAINLQACIGGFTLHIGPYGAVSGSFGRGCA